MEETPPPVPDDSDDSLESTSTVVESSANGSAPAPDGGSDENHQSSTAAIDATGGEASAPAPSDQPAKKPPGKLHKLLRRLNIYLLALGLLVVIAVVIIFVAVTHNRATTSQTTAQSKELSQSQLEKIAAGDTNVGNSGQVLNVASNAVFGGQVLVRQDLDVAGSLKIGGSLSLPNLSVSGSGSFGQLQTTKLTVAGAATIQGALAVAQNLTVAGSTTFAGAVAVNQLTVQSLQLGGDLTLNHHIDTSGGTPSRTPGNALGNGGTVAVSGSDTAGTVNINTGSSPAAGCFVTLSFVQNFQATPHIVVTPVGSAAGGLAYYINRSTTSLSICTASVPPAGQSFAFDYIAFD